VSHHHGTSGLILPLLLDLVHCAAVALYCSSSTAPLLYLLLLVGYVNYSADTTRAAAAAAA